MADSDEIQSLARLEADDGETSGGRTRMAPWKRPWCSLLGGEGRPAGTSVPSRGQDSSGLLLERPRRAGLPEAMRGVLHPRPVGKRVLRPEVQRGRDEARLQPPHAGRLWLCGQLSHL